MNTPHLFKRYLIIIVFLTGLSPVLLSQSKEDQQYTSVEDALATENWDTAKNLLNELIESGNPSPKELGNIYHNLGLVYSELNNFFGAYSYLKKAIEIKESLNLGVTLDMANSLELQGQVSMSMYNYEKAKYCFEKARLIISQIEGYSKRYIRTNEQLGILFEQLGEYDHAFGLFHENYQLGAEVLSKESVEYANVVFHLGQILLKNGDYEQAKIVLDMSNELFLALGSEFKVQSLEVQESIALIYEHTGNYSMAERILLQIIDEKKKIPGISEHLILETLNDLGILYMDLKNTAKARQYFLEVKQKSFDNLGSEHKYYATAINNLAAIAKEEEDYAQAKEYLKQATKIYRNVFGRNHPQYANALNNLASTERLLKEYDSARAHYEDVIKIDRLVFGENHAKYATALNNFGILLADMGHHAAAIHYYEDALRIRESALGINHPSYARSLESLGMGYFSLGKYSKAESYFKRAIDIQIGQIESVFAVMTEKERELFYENIKEDIERYNYIAMQLLATQPELIERIADHQIKVKAILFSSTEKAKRDIQNSGDEEAMRIYLEWNRKKTELAGYYQLGNNQLLKYGIDIEQKEQVVEELEKQIALRSTSVYNSTQETQLTWREVRRSLEDGQVLVDIIRFREFSDQKIESSGLFGFTDKVYYLAVIYKSDSYTRPEYIVLDNGDEMEGKGYKLYYNSLNYKYDLSASYLNFWSKIDDKIGQAIRVFVSPDGVYNKLNPNIFQLSKDKYVVDKYPVSYVTSSRDLVRKSVRESTEKTALLMGNPAFNNSQSGDFFLANLPGAEKEIDEIESLMNKRGWSTTKYKGEEATEFKLRLTYNPTVLHIATHGFFATKGSPISKIIPKNNSLFKSGLLMANASDSYYAYLSGAGRTFNNDGILTSYELMDMDLNNTELVILSACETGLGDITNGEGVFGLQRSFMVAGAKSLILSLSKVQDEATYQMMKIFYENYLESDDIFSAFVQAQDELRREYPNPFIWGAYLLFGTN